MATRNDVTGDLIKTKAGGDKDAYAEGWDRIFGKKRATTDGSDSGHSVNSERDTPLVNEDNLASTQTSTDKLVDSAQLDLFDEERADIIGQNGNIGYGEDAS